MMNKLTLIILLGGGMFFLISCEPEQPTTSKISGEFLLKNASRNLALDFKGIESMTLFDVSSIDLKITDLEYIQPEAIEVTPAQQKNLLKQVARLIDSEQKAPKDTEAIVDMMLSDELVDPNSALLAIESNQDQVLSLELYDKKGHCYRSPNKIQLQKGSNYKMLATNALPKWQEYLILVKGAKDKVLLQKFSVEQ